MYATGEIIENNDIKISGTFSGSYLGWDSDASQEKTIVFKLMFSEGSNVVLAQEELEQPEELGYYKIAGNYLSIYRREEDSEIHIVKYITFTKE